MTWKKRERLTRYPVARPQPGNEGGDERAGDGAADDVGGSNAEEQRIHQQGGFHALARDHQQREAQHTQKRSGAKAGEDASETSLDLLSSCAFRPATYGR